MASRASLTCWTTVANRDHTMTLIVNTFRTLGVPIAPHKTVNPVTQLEYLGIELDTVSMQARLPDHKLQRVRSLVEKFLGLPMYQAWAAHVTIGHLQFASGVIVPDRSFISRLLEAVRGVRELYQFVTLNRQCNQDLTTWHTLPKHWNRVSLFFDIAWTSASDLLLYTDASGTLGFGGFFQGQWFQGRAPHRLELEDHIPDHEPYPRPTTNWFPLLPPLKFRAAVGRASAVCFCVTTKPPVP